MCHANEYINKNHIHRDTQTHTSSSNNKHTKIKYSFYDKCVLQFRVRRASAPTQICHSVATTTARRSSFRRVQSNHVALYKCSYGMAEFQPQKHWIITINKLFPTLSETKVPCWSLLVLFLVPEVEYHVGPNYHLVHEVHTVFVLCSCFTAPWCL